MNRWRGWTITSTRWDATSRNLFLRRVGPWLSKVRVPERLIHAERPVMFDVGANKGLVTLLYSQIPGALVYSFEPGSRAYYCLRRNVEDNHLENVSTFNVGMSDEETFGYLAPFQREAGLKNLRTDNYSLYAPANSMEARRFGARVWLTTIDSFVRHHSVDRIDYLKIDTEGNELRVLHGSERTLSELQPIVQLEVHPRLIRASGTDPQDIDRLLEAFGYRTFAESRGVLRDASCNGICAAGYAEEVFALPPSYPDESIAALRSPRRAQSGAEVSL